MTVLHPNALNLSYMAGWRNWQTQTAQNRPTARSWGFKSLARYHELRSLKGRPHIEA
jgi:hypothetical protein